MSCCKSGRTKAAVLPVPVAAPAKTSFLYSITGMVACCIAVGVLKPNLANEASNWSSRKRSSNVMMVGCLARGLAWYDNSQAVKKLICLCL